MSISIGMTPVETFDGINTRIKAELDKVCSVNAIVKWMSQGCETSCLMHGLAGLSNARFRPSDVNGLTVSNPFVKRLLSCLNITGCDHFICQVRSAD